MTMRTRVIAICIMKHRMDTGWGAGPGWPMAIGPPRAIAFQGISPGKAMARGHPGSMCLVARVPGFAITEFSDVGSSAKCRQVPTLYIR